LTLRTATIFLTASAFSALLLIASTTVAFGQDGKEKNGTQSSELARQAEASFQEAVALSTTKEREMGRLRLLAAVRLWKQIGEPEKAARACLQMGDSYKQGKRYQESLYYYDQALEVKPLLGSIKGLAYKSIAQIYAEIYQNDLALSYYDKAINQARAAKDVSTQTLAWTGLAELRHQRREGKRAITCILRARELNRQQQSEGAEADLLRLTGVIDQENGKTEQARENFEEAVRIYRRIGNEDGHIKILCLLSDLYLVSAQKQAALEQGELAVELAEKQATHALTSADIMRSRDLRWRAWLSQARAQRAIGQKEKAIKSLKWAIHQIEGLYWSFYITTEASAAAFREACLGPYLELIDLLIEQGQISQAYEFAQKARARAMMGLIEARRTTELPKKREQQEKLRELARIVARLRAQSLFSQISPEQQEKLQKDIRDAEDKLREAQLSIEMEQARDRLIWSSPATIKQLQEKITQDNHVIVEFLLGERRSFAWLVSSNDISLEILPGKKELEKAVTQYIELMTTAPNNMYVERDISRLRERGEKLFPILFGRLSERISPGQKLIIVPDGLLHYLPFEALVRNKHYLIEDHEISYLPAAGMLGRDSRAGTETVDRMEWLAFGDPSFGPGAKSSDGKGLRGRPADIARRMRAARGFQLDPLPRTRDEVNYIASLFPADRRQVYLGEDSTERAVKQASLRQYRRLHFACHSLVDERSPSRSAVVLTLNNDTEEDGFLEVSEISELDLDCDLVVLSACQTGRGQLLSGEGIVGLSRAFLYAGARSVVVSLWNVSDISTGQLMKNFYQRLINNTGNAAALREAKLKMVESGRETRHPYYWAAFTVVGKP
jgi:CHAT domain-containing protein